MPARPFQLLTDVFDAGIKADADRVHRPRGSLVASLDMLPHLGGGDPFRTRSGWANLGATHGTGTAVYDLVHAPFSTGEKLVEIQSDKKVYLVDPTTGSASASLGTLTSDSPSRPVFWNDRAIIPASSGNHMYTVSNAGVLAAMAGDPQAAHALGYKGRLLAAQASGNLNRVYVSDQNAITWDLTNNTYVTQSKIIGMGLTKAGAMLFHDDAVTRLRGTTPGALGDIELDQRYLTVGLGQQAQYSICYWRDNLIWVNGQGAYMSDGATFVDLTSQGGIKSLWQYNLADGSNFFALGDVYDDWLVMTICDFVTVPHTYETWICYLPDRSWFKATNMRFFAYAARKGGSGKGLYAARADTNRLAEVGVVFERVDNGTTTDGDGTAILGSCTLQFQKLGKGNQQLGRVWVGYVLRDTGSTSVTVGLRPESAGASGGATTIGTLARTSTSGSSAATDYDRVPVRAGMRGQGAEITFTQTAAAAQFTLYSVEIEYDQLEAYM